MHGGCWRLSCGMWTLYNACWLELNVRCLNFCTAYVGDCYWALQDDCWRLDGGCCMVVGGWTMLGVVCWNMWRLGGRWWMLDAMAGRHAACRAYDVRLMEYDVWTTIFILDYVWRIMYYVRWIKYRRQILYVNNKTNRVWCNVYAVLWNKLDNRCMLDDVILLRYENMAADGWRFMFATWCTLGGIRYMKNRNAVCWLDLCWMMYVV